MTRHETHPTDGWNDPLREQEVQQIRDALRGLRYGTVNIIVQDGFIVQIDRTEKHRLRRTSPAASSADSGNC